MTFDTVFLKGYDKRYVVYNYVKDYIGIHLGPYFLDFSDRVVLWPHVVLTSEGSTDHLSDECFREQFTYVGEL